MQWVVYNHTKDFQEVKVFKSERAAKKYRNEWLKEIETSNKLNAGQIRELTNSQFKIYRCIILTNNKGSANE